MKKSKWKNFYFNSKIIWGQINYQGNIALLRQTKMEYSPSVPYPIFSQFGKQKKTLGEWADENGMNLNV